MPARPEVRVCKLLDLWCSRQAFLKSKNCLMKVQGSLSNALGICAVTFTRIQLFRKALRSYLTIQAASRQKYAFTDSRPMGIINYSAGNCAGTHTRKTPDEMRPKNTASKMMEMCSQITNLTAAAQHLFS